MNPIDPPRVFGDALGSAKFKMYPQDFLVEEILGFDPSGEGEHCLAWIEKTNRNSNDIASLLADKLGIRRRLISHCGLKDKHAVTRQWFSMHLPGQATPIAKDLEAEGVRVLTLTRNTRKLHRGSHFGNRFVIRLRECGFSKVEVATRWQAISERGVPNYFGPQRFGLNGDNVDLARRFLAGELRVQDRVLRGILISAARSFLFNACVGQRVQVGNWGQPLDGEVYGFANNRSLVLPDNIRGDEPQRVCDGTLELTAPLWGAGELISRGCVKAIEANLESCYPDFCQGLARLNLSQERRVMRLTPKSPRLNWETDATLELSFDLPKGTYATTVLRELADT